MQAVPKNDIKKFAQEFAYGDKGFALKAITSYFAKYQSGLPEAGFDGIKPRKGDHFLEVVSTMHPRNQRLALIDLCNNPPKMKNCPDEKTRKELLASLVQSDGNTPIAIEFSKISISGIRDQWWTANSRFPKSPSSTITAARTLIETTCKTIIDENGQVPDKSGDLQKLLKQTYGILNLKTGSSVMSSVNQVLSGFTSITNGLAAISNLSGDRHGSAKGIKLENVKVASLCLHAASITSMFIVEVHLERKYPHKGFRV